MFPLARFSLVPQNLTEAIDYAKLIAGSDLAPKDFKGKPGNVLVAVQMGMELGVPPLQAVQNIAVINGRPCVWGDMLLAIVQNSGMLVLHDEYGQGEAMAKGMGRCRVRRKGESTVHEVTFSKDDAIKAGLWTKEGPWTTNPGRMMQMRARAFALRDKFADVLKGMASREEMEDVIDVEGYVTMPKALDGSSTAAIDGFVQENVKPAPPRVPVTLTGDASAIVRGVEHMTGGKKPFYAITLEDEQGEFKVTTFDDTAAGIARDLIGKPAAVESKQNGKYLNLVRIAPATDGPPQTPPAAAPSTPTKSGPPPGSKAGDREDIGWPPAEPGSRG